MAPAPDTRLEAWLEELGLSAYLDALADNDIDFDLLPDLTAEDLRDIGMSSVGHRRRFLKAAARIGAEAAAAPPASAAPRPAATTALSDEERRVISVLFCDLVGSTRLSAQLDAEDYNDLIARYREVLTAAITPYDSHMSQFLGDGIIVFFGITRTTDHDAENAAAAALEIIASIQALPPVGGTRPQVRIGIATGLNVVPSPETMRNGVDTTAVGEVPNLAARLQEAAPPDGIVVSDATHRRLGALFDCADLGVRRLKGIEGGVKLWQLNRHARAASRFDALRPIGGGAAFVGRTEELRRLTAQSAQARAGFGQIGLVRGEAGLGKSRLVREVLASQGLDPAAQPVLQCTPYHQSSPFHAIRLYLLRRLGVGSGDPAGPLQTLCAALGLDPVQAPDLLGALFQPGGLTPDRREALFGVLTDLVMALAVEADALILEDVQWMDPSTAELLERIAERIPGEPVHVMATSRPAALPHWVDRHRVTVIELAPMAPEVFDPLVRAVAERIAPGRGLSEAQVQDISRRCDGNPIFAEELTRYMLESLSSGEDTASRAMPATLEDSLLARLDRLTLGRRMAQLGAVIGTEFPVAILLAASGLDDAEARRGVNELFDAGILRVGHSAFGPAVSFRHALLRDAAYNTLLRRDRLALHRRIADLLTAEFPDVMAAAPQVAAVQYSQAECHLEAAQRWSEAAQLANDRSAYSEAIGLYRRALRDLGQLPDSADIRLEEMNTRLNLVSVLVAKEGYRSANVDIEMAAVEALSEKLDGTDQFLPLLVTKWVHLGSAAYFNASLELANRIHEITRDAEGVPHLIGRRCMGTSLLFTGQFDASERHLRSFIDSYDHERHSAGLSRYGTSNHAAMSMIGLAEIAMLRDEHETARLWTERARSLAERTGQGHDLCNITLFMGCILPGLSGDYATVLDSARSLRALAEAHDTPVWDRYADLFEGIGLIAAGDRSRGRTLAERGQARAADESGFLSFCFIIKAEICRLAGLISEARSGLDMVDERLRGDDYWLSAEFRRVSALVAHAEWPDTARTQAQLDHALALARRQKAGLFVRRTQDSLDRLLADGAPTPATPAPGTGPVRASRLN